MKNSDSETIIQLLQYYQSLEDNFNRKKIEGIEFNSFNLIHSVFGISETKHTKLLAFFLDPEESHGQGKLFLNKFLEKIDGLQLNHPIDQYKWRVTTEDRNADIVIKAISIIGSEKISIVIENKSNEAVDQHNQLYRYWYEHIYGFFDRDLEKSQDRSKCRIIYLTSGYTDKFVSEISILKPDFIKLEYPIINKEKGFITNWTYFEDIKSWLRDCINAESLHEKHRLKLYIEDYLQFWDNTRFKNDFFMEGLKEELNNNEEKWKSFIEMCQYKDGLIKNWSDDFAKKLSTLAADSGWCFYRANNDDLRFNLNNGWNDIALVYEWEIGLTIWKGAGGKIKKQYKERFCDLLQQYFNFIDGTLGRNDNYIMEYSQNSEMKFDTYEEFIWKANNEETILKNIKEVFEALRNDQVESLFKEIDHDNPVR